MAKRKKSNTTQRKRDLQKKKEWLEILARYDDFLKTLPEKYGCDPEFPETLMDFYETCEMFADEEMHWQRDKNGDFLNSKHAHFYDSIVNYSQDIYREKNGVIPIASDADFAELAEFIERKTGEKIIF